MNQTPVGTRAGRSSKSVKTTKSGEDPSETPREADHMPRSRRTSTTVEETGERGHRELEGDDDEDDLPVQVAVVPDRASLVDRSIQGSTQAWAMMPVSSAICHRACRLNGMRIELREGVPACRLPALRPSRGRHCRDDLLLHVGGEAAPHRQREVVRRRPLGLRQRSPAP